MIFITALCHTLVCMCMSLLHTNTELKMCMSRVQQQVLCESVHPDTLTAALFPFYPTCVLLKIFIKVFKVVCESNHQIFSLNNCWPHVAIQKKKMCKNHPKSHGLFIAKSVFYFYFFCIFPITKCLNIVKIRSIYMRSKIVKDMYFWRIDLELTS